MSQTTINDVTAQVQEFWSPMFQEELLESNILASLVNKEYQGDIKKGGDTVKISQIDRPTATRKTIGTDADTFETEKLVTQQVSLVADQRITAAYELEDVIMLQTQLGDKDSEIRQGLVEALNIELNNYLYSLVNPSTSAPDHLIDSVTNFNSSQVVANRKLAAQAKWKSDGGWYILADPQYYADMISDSTLTSADYVQDRVVVSGQTSITRYGFNIFEDNSAGLITAMNRLGSSSATEEAAIAFHPDFLGLVMQRTPTFQVSSLHAQKKHGLLISVDMIVGAKILNDGDVKHIFTYNT